jgi:glutamate dehydrogenase/leucine dehydrogenase
MSTAFDSVWRRSQQLKVTPRRGAVAVALERVGEAIEVRGLFP